MKYITFFAIGIFATSNLAFADGMSCIGMDESGKTIHLIFDIDTASLNIDGHLLKITGGEEGKSVWTEDFKSDLDIPSKILLTHGKTGEILYQINTVTNETIAKASLVCKRYKQ